MSDRKEIQFYPPIEERCNILTHAVGFVLSVVALVLLVLHACGQGNAWHIVSFSIFGASLIVLFASSTCYHCTKCPAKRSRMKIIDHASIYVLIAGSYAPFMLVTLNGTTGWIVFITVCGLACTGIVLKLFFTGRYKLLSTIMYVCLGWLVIIVIKPLMNNLPWVGFLWLLAGGMAYTLGAVLYSFKSLHFNHAIFHLFVLLGSFCHFMSVYMYVLPLN